MKKETKTKFEKRMKTITVPEGFTAAFGEDTWGFGKNAEKCPNFTLTSADVKFKFDISGSGHTSFQIDGKGWLTFDRTGVEDSFYHVALFDGDDRDLNLDAIIAEQLDRIAKRREYYASAITVPGLPAAFTVAPDGVEPLKKRLRQQGSVSFMPSGFGTGYCVTKNKSVCRFGGSRAKAELEAFFGHSPLYVSTMDCD